MTTYSADEASTVLDFDLDAVSPAQSFEPLPDGDYPVIVERITVKETKSGGKMVNVQLKVTDGEHKGRIVFDGINVVNANDQAQEIGRRQLAGLMHSAGKSGRDVSVLVQSEVIAKVRTQPGSNGYEPKNVVRSYKPASSHQATAQVVSQQNSGQVAPDSGKKAPAFMAKPPTLAR